MLEIKTQGQSTETLPPRSPGKVLQLLSEARYAAALHPNLLSDLKLMKQDLEEQYKVLKYDDMLQKRRMLLAVGEDKFAALAYKALYARKQDLGTKYTAEILPTISTLQATYTELIYRIAELSQPESLRAYWEVESITKLEKELASAYAVREKRKRDQEDAIVARLAADEEERDQGLSAAMSHLQLNGRPEEVKELEPGCLTEYVFGRVDKPHPDHAWNKRSVECFAVSGDQKIKLHPKQRLDPVTSPTLLCRESHISACPPLPLQPTPTHHQSHKAKAEIEAPVPVRLPSSTAAAEVLLPKNKPTRPNTATAAPLPSRHSSRFDTAAAAPLILNNPPRTHTNTVAPPPLTDPSRSYTAPRALRNEPPHPVSRPQSPPTPPPPPIWPVFHPAPPAPPFDQ